MKTAKFKSQYKSKGKNLAKFKASAQSFESGFLTSRARQALTELSQAFIEAPILLILIQIVISGLKLIYLAMLLMKSLISSL